MKLATPEQIRMMIESGGLDREQDLGLKWILTMLLRLYEQQAEKSHERL